MRLMHMRRKCLIAWRAFRERGGAPRVFEIFLLIVLFAALLIIGLFLLSRDHKFEVENLKRSSSQRISEYRRKYDERLKQAAAAHRNRELSKASQHKKEVSKVRDLHQDQIEKIIADIELKLKDLKDLSRAYWDQHALVVD